MKFSFFFLFNKNCSSELFEVWHLFVQSWENIYLFFAELGDLFFLLFYLSADAIAQVNNSFHFCGSGQLVFYLYILLTCFSQRKC